MKIFENSTIGKGLERLLPQLESTDEETIVYALVAKKLIENQIVQNSLPDEFYSSLDYLFESHASLGYNPSRKEIELGERLKLALERVKPYQINPLNPDRRKISRYRAKELKEISLEI